MAKLIIIQRIVPHYRVEFFRRLHDELMSMGIEMTLVYGQHKAGVVPASSKIDEAWAKPIANRYYSFFGREIVTQKLKSKCFKNADLIIVEQANRLLLNYKILLLRMIHSYKVAFWGHGRNFQSKQARRISEKVKKYQLCLADHWFAYTDMTADFLINAGVNKSSITVVNNTVDTEDLEEDLRSLTPVDLLGLKGELSIQNDKVALFCGGMDARKRFPFLIEAASKIRDRVPGFTMIFIGDGPFATQVKQFAKENSWVHYLGKITSAKRSKYFAISDLMLMPGDLGLVVIDSLITGTPIVTTKLDSHNPEVIYLEHDRTAIFAENEMESYVASVVELLLDQAKLTDLKQQCRTDSVRFPLDSMVANFVSGIDLIVGVETG